MKSRCRTSIVENVRSECGPVTLTRTTLSEGVEVVDRP